MNSLTTRTSSGKRRGIVQQLNPKSASSNPGGLNVYETNPKNYD